MQARRIKLAEIILPSAEFWGRNHLDDEVKSAYESGLLKKVVAERFKLALAEVDGILRQYEPEPLNFVPVSGSLWQGFKIDERFGQRHPGNLPAELIRNLLFYYSCPGDVVLDVCSGGGAVLDVAADMVGRTVYGFALGHLIRAASFAQTAGFDLPRPSVRQYAAGQILSPSKPAGGDGGTRFSAGDAEDLRILEKRTLDAGNGLPSKGG